ncbi:hypothetical protein FSST1_006422 [Fusarium sambucinum]
MKFLLTLLAFSITAVLAGPQLNRRDVPKCEDGEDPTSQKLFNNDDMLLRLPFIATILSVVSTQRIGGLGNATVRFFTDDQDCESSDTKAPVLTTRDTPTQLICFNLTDIFLPGNKTISGYRKALRPWEDRTSNISFHLQQNGFDSSVNYTQVRYELPGVDVGEKSSWVLWVYPHLNCDTEVKGFDNYEYPWYEVDCRTKDNGECQGVNYPIKSFAILNGDRNGDFQTWAQLGAATKTSSQTTKLFHTTVAMAIMFAVL